MRRNQQLTMIVHFCLQISGYWKTTLLIYKHQKLDHTSDNFETALFFRYTVATIYFLHLTHL